MFVGRKILLAEPEKAMLDFLYIHTQYKTERDMELLRFDEHTLGEILNEKFFVYLERYTIRALENRVGKLRKAYAL